MSVNLNKMAQSFYDTAIKLNSAVTSMIGLDVKWMKSIPDENGTDVIFQEYTLYNVGCPVALKVLTSNSNYNPGDINMELFGVNYEAPMKIQIDKNSWSEAYGNDLIPQKGDIVYMEIMNCLFEVSSSTPIYGFNERETGFKCQLQKYTPRADRRESDEVKQTISDLTVSENELFGDKISKETSDIVDDAQTNLFNSTSLDQYKTCDSDCIRIMDTGFAGSYYDMSSASRAVIYNIEDIYPDNDEFTYRFLSLHFNIPEESKSGNNIFASSYSAGITEVTETSSGFSARIDVQIPLRKGITVNLTRGSMVAINGQIGEKIESESGYAYSITFARQDIIHQKYKVTNWYSAPLKMDIVDDNIKPMIVGKDASGNTVLNLSIIGNKTLYLKYGDDENMIYLSESIQTETWKGIAVDFSPAGSQLYLTGCSDASCFNINEMPELCQKIPVRLKESQIASFYIPISNIRLTNIRYYKTSSSQNYRSVLTDLTSRTVKNDSITLINDSAMLPNNVPFRGTVR